MSHSRPQYGLEAPRSYMCVFHILERPLFFASSLFNNCDLVLSGASLGPDAGAYIKKILEAFPALEDLHVLYTLVRCSDEFYCKYLFSLFRMA